MESLQGAVTAAGHLRVGVLGRYGQRDNVLINLLQGQVRCNMLRLCIFINESK